MSNIQPSGNYIGIGYFYDQLLIDQDESKAGSDHAANNNQQVYQGIMHPPSMEGVLFGNRAWIVVQF